MAIEHKKRPFTLFEILIVMSLIAMVLGALSFPISRALKNERFERGVEQTVAKLSLAQELMLDFHTDVSVNLRIRNGVLECTLETSCQLPKHIDQVLNRHYEIPGIERMAYENEIRDVIELQYEKTLGATPKGKLILICSNKQVVLMLNGYPAQIKKGDNELKEICEPAFPEEILSAF